MTFPTSIFGHTYHYTDINGKDDYGIIYSTTSSREIIDHILEDWTNETNRTSIWTLSEEYPTHEITNEWDIDRIMGDYGIEGLSDEWISTNSLSIRMIKIWDDSLDEDERMDYGSYNYSIFIDPSDGTYYHHGYNYEKDRESFYPQELDRPRTPPHQGPHQDPGYSEYILMGGRL